MGKLSDRVQRDLDLEAEVVKGTGNLWPEGIGSALGLAVGLAVVCGIGFLFGTLWSRREIAAAIVTVIAFPFLRRTWERRKVAGKMKHEREVRIEVKVDALLGLINQGPRRRGQGRDPRTEPVLALASPILRAWAA